MLPTVALLAPFPQLLKAPRHALIDGLLDALDVDAEVALGLDVDVLRVVARSLVGVPALEQEEVRDRACASTTSVTSTARAWATPT